MITTLARRWWAIVIRGIAGILFGVLTFVFPGISFSLLVLLFGAYAFADGIFALISAVRSRREGGSWWALLLEAAASIAVGVITFLYPSATAVALVYLVAAWAIVTGALELVAAIRLRKEIEGEWLLGLTGVLSVAFGVLLVLAPGPGALAITIWIGAYAIVFGGLLIALGLKLKSWAHPDPGRPGSIPRFADST